LAAESWLRTRGMPGSPLADSSGHTSADSVTRDIEGHLLRGRPGYAVVHGHLTHRQHRRRYLLIGPPHQPDREHWLVRRTDGPSGYYRLCQHTFPDRPSAETWLAQQGILRTAPSHHPQNTSAVDTPNHTSTRR
jgi:hypothetical protein